MTSEKKDLQPESNPEGVRSDLDPNRVLTYDGGKVMPREWFEDTPTQWAIDKVESMTPEQLYSDSLRAGLPRDPRIESEIDIEVLKRLLAADGRDLPES